MSSLQNKTTTAEVESKTIDQVSNKFCCAFCSSDSMQKVMDFGEVALAGGFLSKEQFEDEPKFPLRLFFCSDCYAVQVVDIVDTDVMFKNYFYFSSAIASLKEHFVDYATEVVSRFIPEPSKATVVEIGCNDGVLLRPLADQNLRTVVGIDPATNIVATINDARINTINKYFSETVAEEVVNRFGKADLVVANNVYAHIPDICGVTRGIKQVLADDGVFIFEVHYLGKVLNGYQYDMIYHEHLYYYSLIALLNHFSRHDMTIFDVKPIPIHAGSMRYYVCKNTSKYANNISPRVHLLEQSERAKGFDKIETYSKFASDIESRKVKLMALLEKLKKLNRRVYGYGASGRANTIIQYCGITHDHIELMIDDAPAKSGYYTPGSHFLIKSNEALKTDPPDYVLNFAWGYLAEISEKCRDYFEQKGRMIVPLPDVRILLDPIQDDIL